ncbi:hypothetical protein RD792_001349 [Penstemon davidsonii]|uniref:NADH dehydrogenase-like complex O n=1 Tax=Penstemon davidsonii TaxID=160366 RepID=A0ABR0DPE2_9LAMI|nr:hypothetical protein RD792_001349 [Penstemon davidsonii]
MDVTASVLNYIHLVKEKVLTAAEMEVAVAVAVAAKISGIVVHWMALSQSYFSGISTTTTFNAKIPIRLFFPIIRAVKSSESQPKNEKTTVEESSPNAQTTAKAAPKPKKPVYSMKKGQIVRVDKEKYLNSINYLSVGHPPYYKGLDYIYEDRGEVLDLRIFETGEYALIAWVGIPTAPAWLPTDMLIKMTPQSTTKITAFRPNALSSTTEMNHYKSV